ncbi:recombinase family protein [Corynebacterium amycolatum]|uniref:recombinase family protein n=1 Tax=Corynebacterium amycolatum TaxID=43765 RepID=UPI00223BBC12|nr:recombinase family protein [Corynebacterium amycolatum]MCT1547500.1 recombinase family protein [Corynebacterium amycolatum]
MATTGAQRAAIYARISLDKQEEAGVKRQIHLATKQAEADEAEIVATYVDNNISAFSGEYRPEYDKLIHAIESREIDVVYVYALDRLTRRTKDTLALFELCEKHNVTVKANRGYNIDPSDPASRLTIVILGLIAEQESIDRAARIRAAYEDRARTGRPKTGGRRMFGYESDAVTIVDDEAEALRAAAAMVIAGKTLRETVREVFHARELTATTGRPMTAPTLRDILLNPRVRGISTFNPTDPDTGYRLIKDRQIVGAGNWPAIIDEATGEKLDAILRDPTRKHSHSGNAPRYFLASVLTCTCGDPMYSRSRKNSRGEARRFYTCKRTEPGGTHVSIGAEVDDLIEAVIIKRMQQPDAMDALQQALAPEDDSLTEQLQELTGQRNALLAKREQIEDAVIREDVDMSTFARVSKKIEVQIADLDEAMRELTADRDADPLGAELANGPDFAEWWRSASVEDKRRLTRLLMDIHILPGKAGAKTFDPQRVSITWRQ